MRMELRIRSNSVLVASPRQLPPTDSSPVDPVVDPYAPSKTLYIHSEYHSMMKTIVGAVRMTRGSREMLTEQDDFHPQDDIYSLLFITPFSIFNGAFLYCIFFLAFQGIVIALIGADLLANGTPKNRLNIPHGVAFVVSISQVFALFIATITQQDVINSLYLASVGYHPTNVPSTASKGKWIFANILWFLLGTSIISAYDALSLLYKSTNVIDLFKDFCCRHICDRD